MPDWEEKGIVNSLYELEQKECSDYTQEENVFIYRCIHSENDRIKRVALNTVTLSIMPYIKKRANRLVAERGRVGNLSTQSVDDIISAGLSAFAHKVKMYSPEYNTQISSYVTYWTEQAMEAEIDKEIKGYELPDYGRRAMKFIAKTTPILNEKGIQEPTAQDYYYLASVQGKDVSKYNLTLFERTLELMRCSEQHSVEELEEIGIQVTSKHNVYEEVIQQDDYNAVLNAIDKLAYFDRIAIECKIEADEICESSRDKSYDNRTIYNTAYKLFKEKTKLNKFSQRDFTRLITDATDELSRRMATRRPSSRRDKLVNTSLIADESFDSYFFDEVCPDKTTIGDTFNSEFEKKYPVK